MKATHKIFPKSRRWSGAFTLLELMVVITIGAIIIGLVASVTTGSIKNMRVASALGGVGHQVASAVHIATKENSPVAVRFYRFPNDFEETYFQAYQFLRRDPAGTATLLPVTEVIRLPQGIIFHPGTSFSTILGLPIRSPGAGDPDLSNTLSPSYEFVEFHIRPDGSTDLPKGKPWSLTVINDTPLPSPDTLPTNYRTITINPVTCAVREY